MQDMCIRHRSSYSRCPTWLALLVLVLTGVCSARAKKDVIQFTNGDRVTCEVVKLEKGYLYIKLEYADGTVAIDWSKVARIESPQSFVVADKDAEHYTGKLKTAAEGTSAEELKVQVTGSSTSEIFSSTEIVGIEQTDTSFWQNLHGGIDAGFNYTKQENRAQYSFDSNVVFARTKWSTGANYKSSFSGGGDQSSLRNDLQLDIVRQLRSPRNFYLGYVEFLHNGEQQLDLRSTLGGALGHYFRQTNHSLIGAYGGVVWNREHYSPQATGQGGDSAEAILGTQLNFFRFKTTNFLVDARVYPSLTDLGRTRFDLNTSLKLRIAKNLYWKLGYYLNVDSRPPQNLPKTDYGSTASLGWTF
jgi:putative salt-induced outer membrane protein YdiY